MKRLQKQSLAVCCAALLYLPSMGYSQQSQFASRYAATTSICIGGNGGPAQRAACLQSLQSVLFDMRQQTDGADYDLEIAALALSLVNAYTSLAAPPAQLRALLAESLLEIAQSATDPAQLAQITAIAASISSNSALGLGIDRLLASPN